MNKIKGFCSIFGNVRSNFSTKNVREKMKILKREYNKNNLNEYVLKESTKTKVLDNFVEPDILFNRIKNHPLTIKEKRKMKNNIKNKSKSQNLIITKKRLMSSLSNIKKLKKSNSVIENMNHETLEVKKLNFLNERIFKEDVLDSSDDEDMQTNNHKRYSSLNLNNVLNNSISKINSNRGNDKNNESENTRRIKNKRKETIKKFETDFKTLKRLNTAKFKTNLDENSGNLENFSLLEKKSEVKYKKIININGIDHRSINDFQTAYITAYLPTFLNKKQLSSIERAKSSFNNTKKELSEKMYKRECLIDHNDFLNSLEIEYNNQKEKKKNEVIRNNSEQNTSNSYDGIIKIEEESIKNSKIKSNKVKNMKNSFRKGIINHKLKEHNTSSLNIDKLNRIKEETHLLSMKSVFQSEAFYFPMQKKDYYQLGKMKNCLKQNISSVNDTFFNSLENKVNFIDDSRRLPNLKFDLKGNLFNLIIEIEVDEYLSERNKFEKSILDKKKEVLGSKEDDDILKKQLSKLEHPNVINPECMIQLNLMKRKKQLKLKNDNKKSIETISSEKQKINAFEKTVKEYKNFMKSNIKESNEFSDYFEFKINNYTNINFESGRTKETVLNLLL